MNIDASWKFSFALKNLDFEGARYIYETCSGDAQICLCIDSMQCDDNVGYVDHHGIERQLEYVQKYLFSYANLETIKWFVEMMNTIKIFDCAHNMKLHELIDENIFISGKEYLVDYDGECDVHGSSPLYLALCNGQEEVVKFMLTIHGFNFDTIIPALCVSHDDFGLLAVKTLWRIMREIDINVEHIPLHRFIERDSSFEGIEWYHSNSPFTDVEINDNFGKIMSKYLKKTYVKPILKLPDTILGKKVHGSLEMYNKKDIIVAN